MPHCIIKKYYSENESYKFKNRFGGVMQFDFKSFLKVIAVLLFILSVSGCATKESVENLRNEQSQFREDMNGKWNEFATAYTPSTRAELQENLDAVRADIKSLKSVHAELRTEVAEISKRNRLSEEYLSKTKKNMETSTAENITNQFNQLKGAWDSTERANRELVQNAADNARRTSDSVKNIEEYRDKLRDIQDRIDKLSDRVDRFYY
jgi:chromosome segregation ATPase